VPSREEIIRLYENHENKWKDVRDSRSLYLRWDSFAWPMFEHPSEPEYMTTSAISAYVLSEYAPDTNAKSHKDRIKGHLKRWHPDKFEVRILPRVVEEEREKVKAGMTAVMRGLKEMLRSTNLLSSEEHHTPHDRSGAPGWSPNSAEWFEASTHQAKASAEMRDAAAQNEADAERKEDEIKHVEAESQMRGAEVFAQEIEAQCEEARRLEERGGLSLVEAERPGGGTGQAEVFCQDW